jgi:hypothetical protein
VNDTEGLLNYASFILGRPDNLSQSVDVLLNCIYSNFAVFAQNYSSTSSFAAKLIEILSGQVLFVTEFRWPSKNQF